jgi:hypothetical protein
MKRTGYRDSNQPKVAPKFTATRNGKPITPTVANVDAADVLAQPDTVPDFLKWLNNWPKEPPKWSEVGPNHYKLTLDGVRMEVFSQQRDHSNKPIFGFTLFGVWGTLHTVPVLSFNLKETQQAAINCIDWINNGQKTTAPYTIDPSLAPQDQPQPRPRPVRPVRPLLPLPPAEVVTLPAIRPDGEVVPMRPDGAGTAPQRQHPMQWFNEFFQTDVLRPEDGEGIDEDGFIEEFEDDIPDDQIDDDEIDEEPDA